MKTQQEGFIEKRVHNKIVKEKLFKSRVKWILFIVCLIAWGVFAYYYRQTYNQILNQEKALLTKVIKTKVAMASGITPSTEVEPTEMKEWVEWYVEGKDLDFNEVSCLIEHESGWQPDRMAYNIGKKGVTVDRGIVQINDYWHDEVSNECAYNYRCAIKELVRIRKADGNFNQWHGYTSNCK
jgi:hypothetical protein